MAQAPGGGVRVGGLESAQRAMQYRATTLQYPRVPLKRAQITVFNRIQRNFQRQGSDDGPWAPLSRATARRKAKEGRSPLILIWSGALKRDWDLPDPGDGRTAVVKSKRYYGIYHEEGMGNNPRRRISPTEKTVRALVRDVFTRWINTLTSSQPGGAE